MKIVIVINKLISAGAERLVVDQVREFRRRGIDVDLITLAPERLDDSFMPLIELPDESKHLIVCRSLLDLRALRKITALLREKKPDVLISHLWFANMVGRVGGVLAGVPRIVTFEHNVYDRVKTRKQLFIDRFLQRYSYRIVAVSASVRDSLVRHGIAPSRIVVIDNGIQLSQYRDARAANEPKSAFTYLFIGRLVRQKAVDVLLDAFSQMKRGEVWIVGDGDDRAALEEQARKLGILPKMRFLGVRGDIPSLMRVADCFLLPSRYEGMPMVLIEAMAAGMPCVVSDFASARDLLRDGVSGLIVPIDDAKALASAMQQIADDPGLATRLGQGAMREATRFSIEAHVGTLLDVVRT